MDCDELRRARLKLSRKQNTTFVLEEECRWQREMLSWMKVPSVLHWIFTPFLHVGDTPDTVRQLVLFVTVVLTVTLAEGGAALLMAHRCGTSGTSEQWLLDPVTQPRVMCSVLTAIRGGLSLASATALLHLYKNGLRTITKVSLLSVYVVGGVCVSIVSAKIPFYWSIIILLNFCVMLQSESDKVTMDRLAIVFQIVVVSYGAANALDDFMRDSAGEGIGLHQWVDEEKYNWTSAAPLFPIIPLLNFQMIKSYADGMRFEQRQLKKTSYVAYEIAEKLADYDLDAAEKLLCTESESPVTKELTRLLSNLRTYRAFLPPALFAKYSPREGVIGADEFVDTPNQKLRDLMVNQVTTWTTVNNAVARITDPGYTLSQFHQDMVSAFPELELYRDTRVAASGLTGADEYQRTLGALYAVYCFLRLDLDGKEVFSFGVGDDGRAVWDPTGHPDETKKRNFYNTMAWNHVRDLLLRAGLVSQDDRSSVGEGQFRIRNSRVVAMLALTALHDIMKNPAILPTVQIHHAPYEGHSVGETIQDHDVALAYVLDHYPTLLPSYHGLAPGQRAPILFTQGKMGFNNGWLVQGEAPPGALFNKFKKVIMQGRASASDVNFYFFHWLTDLAGAEPFGDKTWPGAEKFTVKFPPKVLSAFLESFAFVDKLAISTEVEVMEDYLKRRYESLGDSLQVVRGDSGVAVMRLSLMAQGFEHEMLDAFARLPKDDAKVLALELARTGCKEQFLCAPAHLTSEGPALLIYYAPALVQKAHSRECYDALRVLASVCRAARRVFPLCESRVEETVTIRIDALKVLSPTDIIKQRPWHMRRTSAVDAEVFGGKRIHQSMEGCPSDEVTTLMMSEPIFEEWDGMEVLV